MGKAMKQLLIFLAIALVGCHGDVRGADDGRRTAHVNSVGERDNQPTDQSRRQSRVAPAHYSENALLDFEERFSSNEVFECSGAGVNLSVGLSPPFTSDAGFNGLPQSRKASVLQLDIVKNGVRETKRVVSAWGFLAVDPSDKRKAQLKLNDGRVADFDRFASIPDSDAEDEAFDSTPFFTMDFEGKRYICGMALNPK